MANIGEFLFGRAPSVSTKYADPKQPMADIFDSISNLFTDIINKVALGGAAGYLNIINKIRISHKKTD